MKQDEAQTRIKILLEALPYIRKLKGSLLVIKFGGSVIDYPNLVEDILYDISFLRILGMKPIVIHGGGKAITRRLHQEKIETKMVDGLRYTCDKSIKLVTEVLNEEINKKLHFILSNFSINPLRIDGTNILTAKKKQNLGTDLGLVGEVINIDSKKILDYVEKGFLPIISPLARGKDKKIYNVNADEVASSISVALNVRRLIFITNVPGILTDLKDDSSIIKSIRVNQIDNMIKKGTIKGGMLPKVRSSIECLQKGVKKVHFIDGNFSHSLLLEILSDKGVGTEIVF